MLVGSSPFHSKSDVNSISFVPFLLQERQIYFHFACELVARCAKLRGIFAPLLAIGVARHDVHAYIGYRRPDIPKDMSTWPEFFDFAFQINAMFSQGGWAFGSEFGEIPFHPTCHPVPI